MQQKSETGTTKTLKINTRWGQTEMSFFEGAGVWGMSYKHQPKNEYTTRMKRQASGRR